jgi:hypothetical protein
MRTSPSLTESEIQAFTQFATDHEIIIDGETRVRNADILCNSIINRDSDITPEALSVSFAKVGSQLQLKSPTYKRADELASKLSPEEIDAYKVWAKGQKLLIGLDGSEEGYANVKSLLGWMRGNPVTGHNLDLALGNIINNPQFGRIYFKPQPKQDRSIGPGGKINHALVNRSEEGFMPRSQKNRTQRQVMEDNRAKTETQPTPVSINVEYQAKAESLQGRSHGQTDQAKKLFVMVPNTTTIDWAATHAARLRFLTGQAPLIRR